MKRESLMKKRKSDDRGFTLIEVIVTLLLVGVTAVLAGMWIVNLANGYVFAKMNAGTVQKAQLAMTRLTMEFTRIRTVEDSVSAPTQITYTRTGPSGATVSGIVSINGTVLQLQLNGSNAATLSDGVETFTLAYCDDVTSTSCSSTWGPTSKIIEITLMLTGANNTTSTFTKRVTPRYL